MHKHDDLPNDLGRAHRGDERGIIVRRKFDKVCADYIHFLQGLKKIHYLLEHKAARLRRRDTRNKRGIEDIDIETDINRDIGIDT